MIYYFDSRASYHFSPDDSIFSAKLTNRCKNALRRSSIRTIRELLQYDMAAIGKIKGLGTKSTNEIQDFLSRLKWQADGQQIYPLTHDSLSLINGDAKSVKVLHFLLTKREETHIEDMNITVQAYNCLRRAGYRTTNEIIAITRWELLQIKNLGCNTADDLLSELNKIYRDDLWLEIPCAVKDLTSIENIIVFLKDLSSHCSVPDKQILYALLQELSEFYKSGRNTDLNALFQCKTYRSIMSV